MSVPQFVGAALVLVGMIGLVTLALYLLGDPARSTRRGRGTRRRRDSPDGGPPES